MAEQELDLFDVSDILPAELIGAGAAQVMRPESLDPDLFGRLLDHRPDGPAAHTLLDIAAFRHRPEQLQSSTPAAVIQALIPCLGTLGSHNNGRSVTASL